MGGQTVGSVVALLEAIMEQVVGSVDQYANELAGTFDHLEERSSSTTSMRAGRRLGASGERQCDCIVSSPFCAS